MLVIVGCFPAKAVATSPVPVIETLAAATEATLNAELVVSAACFPLKAEAMSPVPVIETDATLKALLVVKVACFPFTAAARPPVMPATETVPFR